MTNVRFYGDEPFTAVVVHGGPGAAGEMAPVARGLSTNCGVLEPLQTEISVDNQVQELKSVIEYHAVPPITLIGYSWGAWLSFILAAKHPHFVKKLVLVSSGPFESKYIHDLISTRLNRLDEPERIEAAELLKELDNPESVNENALERLGELLSKTDSYDPLPDEEGEIEVRQDIYRSVWPEADELRRSGELLRYGELIKCPVAAIHGAYDPHPAEGVKEPLSRIIKDFEFILLKNCGHKPWIERQAKDRFYEILRNQIE